MSTHEATEKRDFYYYLRDRDGHPFGTVCLTVMADVNGDIKGTARGVAICCRKDNVNKVYGRGLAQIRAAAALARRNTLERGRPVSKILKDHHRGVGASEGFMRKTEFWPKLTKFEKSILDKSGLKLSFWDAKP